MTTFPKYKRYKDSGIEWLGEVPEHWEVEKGKWLFLKMDRQVRPEDGVVTAFRDGQVTLRTNRRTDGFTNAIKEHGYQGIRKGDLVIYAMDAFAGAIGVSESDGKSTPVYSACVPRKPNTVSRARWRLSERARPDHRTNAVDLVHRVLEIGGGGGERDTVLAGADFAGLPDFGQRCLKFGSNKHTAVVAKKIPRKQGFDAAIEGWRWESWFAGFEALRHACGKDAPTRREWMRSDCQAAGRRALPARRRRTRIPALRQS